MLRCVIKIIFLLIIAGSTSKLEAMTAQGKNNNFLDVTTFGAIPNDGLDDGDEIQRAIDTARGKVVFFPKGKYQSSRRIILPSGASLLGEDGAVITATKLLTPSFNADFDGKIYEINSVIFCDGSDNLNLKNLTIDANGSVQEHRNVSAVFIRNSNHGHLSNILVRNNKALDLSKGSGAFMLDKCKDMKLVECGADKVDTEGLLLRRCSYISVTGGEWKNSSSSCIGTQYGDHIDIYNVRAHDSKNSVISLNSTYSTVQNSTVFNSFTFFPVNLGHRTSYRYRKPATNSLVKDCVIFNGYAGGINVAYGDSIKILNNKIYDCRRGYEESNKDRLLSGISATFWADKITIIGNDISNCTKGIQIKFGREDQLNNEYTGGHSLVENNTVRGCVLAGVEIANAYDVNVTGNNVYGNNTMGDPAWANLHIEISNEKNGLISIQKNSIGKMTSNDKLGLLVTVKKGIQRIQGPVRISGNQFQGNQASFRYLGPKLSSVLMEDFAGVN